ncbi:MAG: hypothetical protein GY804_01315 [Alphaproteobacteria bacterium]|nr:hypothetical protein [Alphaproteobacteria bacterium]
MYCYAPTKEYLYRRILIVGILWSLLFLGGFRSTMIDVWDFDLANYRDWVYVWNLWIDGWVIDEMDEVIFFALVLALLPMWITGWSAISSVKWERIYLDFMARYNKKIKDQKLLAMLKEAEKKGLPEIADVDLKSLLTLDRPRPIGGQLALDLLSDPPLPFGQDKERKRKDKAEKKAIKAATKKAQKEEEVEVKTAVIDDTEAVSAESIDDEIIKLESAKEILEVVGYELVEDKYIANCHIDYVAISKSSALLCLVDRDKGEWLADEESFNGEEPLWFSESKHRGSPIFKVKRARDALLAKLDGQGIEVAAIAIIKEGTIINGQDMLNTWLDMNVMVCRIGNGGPDELPSFARVMKGNKAEPADPANVEKIKQAIEELVSGEGDVSGAAAGGGAGVAVGKADEEKIATKIPEEPSKVEVEQKVEAPASMLTSKPKVKKSSISLSKSKTKTVATEEKAESEVTETKSEVESKVTETKVKVDKKSEDESKVAEKVEAKPTTKKKVIKRIVRKKKIAKPTPLVAEKPAETKASEEKPKDKKPKESSDEEKKAKKSKISLKKNP